MERNSTGRHPVPVRKCPKCRTKTPTNLHESDSTIILAEGPRELQKVSQNENEFQLRIWSYMEPPKISDPMSNINPERIEMVRELLNGTLDEPIKTRIDSRVSIQLLADGTVRKIKSRTEYKIYPPFYKMDKTKIRKICRPDCTVIEVVDTDDQAKIGRSICDYY